MTIRAGVSDRYRGAGRAMACCDPAAPPPIVPLTQFAASWVAAQPPRSSVAARAAAALDNRRPAVDARRPPCRLASGPNAPYLTTSTPCRLDNFDPNARGPGAAKPEAFGGAARDIDDPPPGKGPAVVDGEHHRSVIGEVGDPHLRAKG